MAEGGARVLVKCRFEDDATELEIYDTDFPFQVFSVFHCVCCDLSGIS